MPTKHKATTITMKSIVTGGSDKSPYRECLDWIYDQKAAVETLQYGRNKAGVAEAITKQSHRIKQIDNYQRDIDVALSKTDRDEERSHLRQAYNSLKDLARKKLNCLQTMLEIARMEDFCGTLGTEFDARAVHLVSPEVRDRVTATQGADHIPGFIAASSQDCVFAAKDNWRWLVKLVQCVEIHLKNAAAYHQFFHEQDEGSHYLANDLERLHNSFELFDLKGDYDDAKRLLQELEEILTSFRQWETKINFSWDQAMKLVPVHLRVQGVQSPTPIRSLADYRTDEITIREEEDLLLIDNSKNDVWKIRNSRGQEAMVPALICLIPGPHRDAVEAAVKMRLQLLASWTNSLKRIGKRLIFFMLKVFKPDYQEDEINIMQSIDMPDKEELVRILGYIEDTMKTHWGEHEGFINLQERMLMLRMILENTPDHRDEAQEGAYKALVVQVSMLEKLMKQYKELWRMWETYKVALEASRQPELMLIVDKWEQLQFVTREYFTNVLQYAPGLNMGLNNDNVFWQTELGFNDIEKSIAGMESLISGIKGEGKDGADGSAVNGGSPGKVRQIQEAAIMGEGVETMEESVVATSVGVVGATATAETEDDSDFGYATETKTAETEQVSQSEVEESKTFVIRSVIDPRNSNEISLQEAIMNGIINPNEGMYVNPDTKESLPIPVAMSAGQIKVEFTSTRRTKEKKSSMGIITVKTIREHARSYTIKLATDTRSGAKLSLQEATTRGIINESTGRFKDTRTGKYMLIAEAIEKHLVDIDQYSPGTEPEVMSKTYAVRAVVDRKAKKTISFQEAVQRGIIDRESGAYHDTMSGDTMYVGDAIMRGFLKARPIEDTSSLDIDPENRMVIDKTSKIKEKLVKPLGALGALRKAAFKS